MFRYPSRGFTLIELLVVIAIIAILAAVLFPVFARAREKARQTACTGNLRQIALATAMYAQEHEETLPPAGSFWSSLKLPAAVLRCPDSSLPLGYVYNSEVAGKPLGDPDLGDHTKKVLTGDGAAADQIARQSSDFDRRHNDKILVAFLDQHVELVENVAFARLTTNPKDGAALVYVPAGSFMMGEVGIAEPVHQVTLTRGYYLYRDEVTVGQYQAFCTATGRPMPPLPVGYTPEWTAWAGHESYPMVMVDWTDATAYAAWAGAALPTEAEWEFAACGPGETSWPWGNTWDTARCVNYDNSSAGTRPVGSYPTGNNWCGARDMAGNVWEWCADWYGAYGTSAQTDPAGPDTGPGRVLRGGSWNYSDPDSFRAANRYNNTPTYRIDYFGFRCVSRQD